MSDNALTGLDDAFARREDPSARQLGAREDHGVVPFLLADREPADLELARPGHLTRPLRDRLPWLELYFAVQFGWGALLFVPGAQEYRAVIRALPYVSSLVLLALYLPAVRGTFPAGSRWMLGALAVLAANLLHPTSQPYAGIAQWLFQLAIAAPLFWACGAVRSRRQIARALLVIFLLNCASAGLGILQVYFPDRMMPAQLNSLGLQLNDFYIDSQSYMGPDGRIITRPPGLSDMPGGAALAGGLAALFGMGLVTRSKSFGQRVGALAAIAIGLTVIYLTQVRSILLMVIAAAIVLCLVALRQRRLAAAGWIAAAGGGLLVAGFLWASAIGGQSVEQRFLGIGELGAVRTYQESRGHFLSYTLEELLNEFPLGAGVGRWGMMNTYFGDSTDLRSGPLYVEIQLTGWLLDGGIPMWILYGGALLMALLAAFRLTGSGNDDLRQTAALVLAVQVMVVSLAMVGPVFNTQMGMLFWACASLLYGMATVPLSDDAAEERA